MSRGRERQVISEFPTKCLSNGMPPNYLARESRDGSAARRRTGSRANVEVSVAQVSLKKLCSHPE